jgi:hypothetical protein
VDRKGVIKAVNRDLLSVIGEKNQSRITDHELRIGDTVIEIDPKYFRPTEVDFLKADITKARQKLGWEPRTTFDELVKIMVDYDMKLIKLTPIGEGIKSARKNYLPKHDFRKIEDRTMLIGEWWWMLRINIRDSTSKITFNVNKNSKIFVANRRLVFNNSPKLQNNYINLITERPKLTAKTGECEIFEKRN